MTISTVGQKHPCVKVYDSLYNSLPFETKDQVAALLHTKEYSIKLVYARVQVWVEVLDTGSELLIFFLSLFFIETSKQN